MRALGAWGALELGLNIWNVLAHLSSACIFRRVHSSKSICRGDNFPIIFLVFLLLGGNRRFGVPGIVFSSCSLLFPQFVTPLLLNFAVLLVEICSILLLIAFVWLLLTLQADGDDTHSFVFCLIWGLLVVHIWRQDQIVHAWKKRIIVRIFLWGLARALQIVSHVSYLSVCFIEHREDCLWKNGEGFWKGWYCGFSNRFGVLHRSQFAQSASHSWEFKFDFLFCQVESAFVVQVKVDQCLGSNITSGADIWHGFVFWGLVLHLTFPVQFNKLAG